VLYVALRCVQTKNPAIIPAEGSSISHSGG